jgi:hypothetical protein
VEGAADDIVWKFTTSGEYWRHQRTSHNLKA